MNSQSIKPGSVVRGPTLPEAVEVLAVVPLGESLKIIGRGLKTGLTFDPVDCTRYQIGAIQRGNDNANLMHLRSLIEDSVRQRTL